MLYNEQTFFDITEYTEESYIIHREDPIFDFPIEDIANNIGFSAITVKYDMRTFGAAACMSQRMTWLVNPYYKISIPAPAPPAKQRIMHDVLPIDTAPKDIRDINEYTDDELKVFQCLPNGWTSSTGQVYLGLPITQPMLRVNSNLPLYEYQLKDYLLLHPQLPRPLNDAELNLILENSAMNWAQEVILSSEILAEPNKVKEEYNLNIEAFWPPRQDKRVAGTFPAQQAFNWGH